ncbi:restriction endonuclease subunit S [Mycoplasma bradburyae]|uniref:restriction endonuclease subunit S n=1 Tax=Mycoplasma bradburyae TaxID=2963128 RepID=UPI0020CB72AB|nr:restriction endonuclease subunit S [Mycoplasma bradburyae]UTS70629.1 restriction endonuclease subunit S [Mycoplasma bradburyae]
MKWVKKRLGDICKIAGGGTPSTQNKDYYKDGTIPWITPKDLSTNKSKYIEKGDRNITKEGLDSCSAKILPKGSILFSARGSIGHIAIAKNELTTNQSCVNLIPNNNINNLFLYYCLLFNKTSISVFGGGTTFKSITGKELANIKIKILINKQDQIKISKILDLIDQKIDINSKINDNLF